LTGAVTAVNPANSIGIDVNDIISTYGMDFDNTTGTLYAFLNMIASPSACSTDGLFEDGFEEN